MRKTTRYLVLIVFVLGVIFLGLWFLQQSDFNKPKNNAPIFLENKINDNKPEQIKISIIVGKLKLTPTVLSGTSLYDVLMSEKNNGNLVLVGKESPGLGFFVTEIGDLKSTDKKFVVYDINGQSATVGISSYYPKDGDVIEWKYTE